jgi:Flp pilus assembly protein TadB
MSPDEQPLGEAPRPRKRLYFVLMGTCVVLILLAWNVVRLWSTTAAIVMSVVAAVLPPTAAIVANWGRGG